MKNNEKDYWFSAKRYGYGWGLPVKREGWITLLVFAVAYFAPLYFLFGQSDEAPSDYMLYYVIWAVLCVSVLVFVVRAHGPPAKWRWGKKDMDK